MKPEDIIPDVRDGLTRVERIILYVLGELRKEFGDRHVSSFLLYGRVVELIDITPQELQQVMTALADRHTPT